MILIGYSGHAFVVSGILNASGRPVTGYCDIEEKKYNPYNLIYIGRDDSPASLEKIREQGYFISIGSNLTRRKIYEHFATLNVHPINAIHPSAIIDRTVKVALHNVMISAGVIINPLADIETGAICNSGCIIEHECKVGEFAHIGPGAVLCGNVTVGANSFVGAASVIRQGVKIGNNVMIGAGAVVVKDITDNETVVGNPSRSLIR